MRPFSLSSFACGRRTRIDAPAGQREARGWGFLSLFLNVDMDGNRRKKHVHGAREFDTAVVS